VLKRPEPPSVRFRQDTRRSVLLFGRGQATFKRGTPAEKVLALLAEHGSASKKRLVEEALGRSYDSSRDDKLIYHHIHALREKFRELNLPDDVLVLEDEGYLLQAKVQIEREEI
jgi:DNA-binding response OmpR family regulator